MTASDGRTVLLVGHTGRAEAVRSIRDAAQRFAAAGVAVRVLADEAPDLGLDDVTVVAHAPTAADGCELVVVFGGDGTLLRAAELARPSGTPLLGVNLGHVGFLAEAEREELKATVDRIVRRDYTVEERMALEVNIHVDGRAVDQTWALNEVSVEKAARERMLQVTLEIDGRPLSTWGCDGVVVATPTGSTAYAFSAGGPVVWPDVEAMLVVPLSAHALFARPLVVGPECHLAIELVPDAERTGVLWADGRRSRDLPTGARVEVTRSAVPVRLARLANASFTDRLVAKFDLSVDGWRGASRRDIGRAAAVEV